MNGEHDVKFMQLALKLAQRADKRDEIPVGAIVIDDKELVVGAGYNQVERKKQQTAHAEIIAITKACKQRNDWRLNGCWLYVTLQPCLMCLALAVISRMEGIVYGAESPLFGYHLDKEALVWLYKENIIIRKDVCAPQAAALLKNFFQRKRKKNE